MRNMKNMRGKVAEKINDQRVIGKVRSLGSQVVQEMITNGDEHSQQLVSAYLFHERRTGLTREKICTPYQI